MENFEQQVDIKGMSFWVEGYFDKHWKDDSFSHNHGIEKCGHYEARDIVIEEAYIIDEDGEQWKIDLGESLKKNIIESLEVLLGEY